MRDILKHSLLASAVFIILLTLVVVIARPAEAAVEELEEAYFLAPDVWGTIATTSNATIQTNCTDVNSYSGPCIKDGYVQFTFTDSFLSAPNYDDFIAGSDINLYLLFADEVPPNRRFGRSIQTSLGGTSGEWSESQFDFSVAVATNLYLAKIDGSNLGERLILDEEGEYIEYIRISETGCNNFCRVAIGFAFSTLDLESEMVGVTNQAAAFDFMENVINNSPPLIPITVNSQIIEVTSPLDGSVTASTTVDLSVDYVSNTPLPNEICFGLADLTFGQTLTPICEEVNQQGFPTFSTSTVLTAGHEYQVWAYLSDDEGVIHSSYYGDSHHFSVVTAPPALIDPGMGWGVNPDPITGTTTTALCEVIDAGVMRAGCHLAMFLFTPSAESRARLNQAYANLDTKIPFSVLSELGDAWEEIDLSERPEKSFNFIWKNEEIPVVASSTFNTYLGDDSVGIIRYWIAVGLWVSLAFLLYFRVSKLI